MLSFLIFGGRSHLLPVSEPPVPDPAPLPMTDTPAPALKDWFDKARFEHIADEVAAVHPGFDRKRFLKLALQDLDELSLMQRLRRTTESLHATLPEDYRKALHILRDLAPKLNHSFVSLVLPDYVSLYGLDDFDVSLEALKFFTVFGSSEFAIRPFLRQDLKRTLKVMETWSRDENDAVRRLASEGCRPRLPWSFRLEALIADPSPTLRILENLKADPSLYVRKSVANHLNDMTKDHPGWVLDRLENWPLENAHTAWIARHALRSLIKKGDPRALAVIGAGEKADVQVESFTVSPKNIQLGQKVRFSLQLKSRSARPQRLVVDYAIHYVKKSGSASAKVFKWKELTLAPGESVSLTREQMIKDFTTRVHHAGHHEVEILINGETMAKGGFDLAR